MNYFGRAGSEENAIEEELIRALLSNDPNLGYNQWPKHSIEIDGAN